MTTTRLVSTKTSCLIIFPSVSNGFKLLTNRIARNVDKNMFGGKHGIDFCHFSTGDYTRKMSVLNSVKVT